MSRVYFHSPSETREIPGRERAWMGCLTNDIAAGVIIPNVESTRLAKLVPPGAFCLSALTPVSGSAYRFADSLRLWMNDFRSAWLVDGQNYDCWQLSLNTCLAVGANPLKLCARLHGQCEIQAFVRGENRAWLAGIIREGLASGVMRQPFPKQHEETTWASVATWLESRSDEPVVTSYSVCEQFPNPGVADWQAPIVDGEANEDAWYDLPAEERWALAWKALQENGPELKPDGWSEYRFGHNKDAFWLDEQMRKLG